MADPRYTLTLRGAQTVVRAPDGERVFPTLAQATEFIACMNAVERDIARLVRCHGLAATMRATLATFGGRSR